MNGTAIRVSALALAAAVAGCSAVGDITGAVAGIVTGTITANPAIGIGVGVGVKAAADSAAQHIARSRKRNEHEAIAAAIAEAGVGETRPWAVDQRVTGDAYGEVRVIRVIENALAQCKEVAFSVVEGEDENAPRSWFTTTACEENGRWKWAVAEPAVDRWVNLQ